MAGIYFYILVIYGSFFSHFKLWSCLMLEEKEFPFTAVPRAAKKRIQSNVGFGL